MGRHDFGVPLKPLLSLKTQPLPHLLSDWSNQVSDGVEVVSEAELVGALGSGCAPGQIVVNGLAKHTWLPRSDALGLTVQLDSLAEGALIAQAARQGWRVGLRFRTSAECDPDEPEFGGPFGLTLDEAGSLVDAVRASGLDIDVVHFHLGSNISDSRAYDTALAEVASYCDALALKPRVVNVGGGLPAPYIRHSMHSGLAEPDVTTYARILRSAVRRFPGLQEYWCEHGRYLLARSGVLVVSVLDVKDRDDCRYVICDGGRTNHALVSDWEEHRITLMTARYGPRRLTTLAGPNCMAFDRLARRPLPPVRAGDHIVWHDAGAYHLQWETRFSRGHSAVYWCDRNDNLRLARRAEPPDQWWRSWTDAGLSVQHGNET